MSTTERNENISAQEHIKSESHLDESQQNQNQSLALNQEQPVTPSSGAQGLGQ